MNLTQIYYALQRPHALDLDGHPEARVAEPLFNRHSQTLYTRVAYGEVVFRVWCYEDEVGLVTSKIALPMDPSRPVDDVVSDEINALRNEFEGVLNSLGVISH